MFVSDGSIIEALSSIQGVGSRKKGKIPASIQGGQEKSASKSIISIDLKRERRVRQILLARGLPIPSAAYPLFPLLRGEGIRVATCILPGKIATPHRRGCTVVAFALTPLGSKTHRIDPLGDRLLLATFIFHRRMNDTFLANS